MSRTKQIVALVVMTLVVYLPQRGVEALPALQSDCVCAAAPVIISTCECHFWIAIDPGFPKHADCAPFPTCEDLGNVCRMKGRVYPNCGGPSIGKKFDLSAPCETATQAEIPCSLGGSVIVRLECEMCNEPPEEE